MRTPSTVAVSEHITALPVLCAASTRKPVSRRSSWKAEQAAGLSQTNKRVKRALMLHDLSRLIAMAEGPGMAGVFREVAPGPARLHEADGASASQLMTILTSCQNHARSFALPNN